MVRKLRIRGLLFTLPALAIYTFVVGVPSLATLTLAFTEWRGAGSPHFVGLANFTKMLTQGEWVVRVAIKNNLLWMVLMLIFNISLGLLVAGLLRYVGRSSRQLYRLVFFLPVILPRVVVAEIWKWLYHPFYGLNELVNAWGISLPGLGNPNTVLIAIAVVGIWCWWGFPLVIFLSALQQIDNALYEAAAIDGANRLQTFIHITVPLLRTTLVFVIILTTILSFQIFDLIYIMTWGGPGHASEVLATLIFKEGILQFHGGYASALAAVQVLLSSGAIWAYIYVQKKGWEV